MGIFKSNTHLKDYTGEVLPLKVASDLPWLVDISKTDARANLLAVSVRRAMLNNVN